MEESLISTIRRLAHFAMPEKSTWLDIKSTWKVSNKIGNYNPKSNSDDIDNKIVPIVWDIDEYAMWATRESEDFIPKFIENYRDMTPFYNVCQEYSMDEDYPIFLVTMIDFLGTIPREYRMRYMSHVLDILPSGGVVMIYDKVFSRSAVLSGFLDDVNPDHDSDLSALGISDMEIKDYFGMFSEVACFTANYNNKGYILIK